MARGSRVSVELGTGSDPGTVVASRILDCPLLDEIICEMVEVVPELSLASAIGIFRGDLCVIGGHALDPGLYVLSLNDVLATDLQFGKKGGELDLDSRQHNYY